MLQIYSAKKMKNQSDKAVPTEKRPDFTLSVLAIGGGSNRILQDEEGQRATWASYSKKDVFICWVRAASNKETQLDDNQILWTKGEEKFENILQKRIESLKWTIENRTSKYYLLTNSSSYIRIEKLMQDLKTFPSSGVYFGPAGVEPGIPSEFVDGTFYIGGGFIILSQDVAELLSGLNPKSFHGIADDLAIGRFLVQHNIFPKPLRFSNLSYGYPIQNDAYLRVRHIKKPDITIKRMKELSNLDLGSVSNSYISLREAARMWKEVLPIQFGLRKVFFIWYTRAKARLR